MIIFVAANNSNSFRCAGKSKPPATTKRRNDDDSDSDVDGAPLRSDSHPATPSSSSNATTDKSKLPAGFVPSKWETIEPEEVCACIGRNLQATAFSQFSRSSSTHFLELN